MRESNNKPSFVADLYHAVTFTVVFMLFVAILAVTREGMRFLGDWFGMASSVRLALMVTVMSLMGVTFFLCFRYGYGLRNREHANDRHDQSHGAD